MEKIKLSQAFDKIGDYFSPKVIGSVNNEYVKLAKIKGEDIPWHNHEQEDELFYVIKGKLLMEIEHQPSFLIQEGELFVVEKGINHRVSAEEKCLIMLIESKTTEHTGKVKSKVTKTIAEQLGQAQ